MKSPMTYSLRKALVLCVLAVFLQAELPVPAQQQTQPSTQQQNQQTQQDQNAPEAGGPAGDTGAIAIPKKKENETPPPPPPEPKVKNPPGLENYSLRVNVPVVNVDVGVILEKTHQFVPNLQKENFRIYEDGVPQTITDFRRIQAPITAVLLVEFAANSWWFIQDMENAA
ncbi:MAG: VWA domain-containing protein, partial [Acidobacterium ailaaui]|nr:VWA domain-containing protein [Pseudacidobacterium ailaaui]